MTSVASAASVAGKVVKAAQSGTHAVDNLVNVADVADDASRLAGLTDDAAKATAAAEDAAVAATKVAESAPTSKPARSTRKSKQSGESPTEDASQSANLIAAADNAWTGKLIGSGAILVGLGTTLWSTVKDSLGKDGLLGSSFVFGPTAGVMAAGMGFLALSEKGGIKNIYIKNALRGGALSLVLGGILGWALGTTLTVRHATESRRNSNDASSGTQKPSGFINGVTASVNELNGVEVASAQIVTTKGGTAAEAEGDEAAQSPGAHGEVQRIRMYLDMTDIKQLDATDIEDALVEARALVQGDEKNRSLALIRTSDGKLNAVRFIEPLDQIDGRFYTEGNEFDDRYPPEITAKVPGLAAIVGVEKRYIYEEPWGVYPG